MRIVSLVPSLTETLCDLGLKSNIVGMTSFCIKPSGLHKIAKIVGGTKDPDIGMIEGLNPTHIIFNEEENRREDFEACRHLALTVLTSPKSPSDVPPMLRMMGDRLQCVGTAGTWASQIEGAIKQLRASVRNFRSSAQTKRFLYFIWRQPYMVASKDTYISRLLELAGWQNIAPTHSRYPEIDIDEIKSLPVDQIFLSSEPYPFRKRDAKRLREEINSQFPIAWIDGKDLSWFGTPTLETIHQLILWTQGEKCRVVRTMD